MSAQDLKQLPPLTALTKSEPKIFAGDAPVEVLHELAISLQGRTFIVFAGLISGMAVLAKKWPESVRAMAASGDHTELIVLSTLIVLLGVPHGALDTVFAQRSYRLHTVAAWGLFASAYLLAVGAVVLLWQLTPILFLSGFLLISAAHFSGDHLILESRLLRLRVILHTHL